jgi:hypothetical protein
MDLEQIECPACEGDLQCWVCDGKDENCDTCDDGGCPRCEGLGIVPKVMEARDAST